MEQALIIFVKNPVLGKVKTRLAATIGDQEALRVYEALLAHTQEEVNRLKNTTVFVFYSDQFENDNWNRTYFKMNQEGIDLGERMNHAFDTILTRKYAKTVIIGSDCYDLNAEIIQDGFDALNDYDSVVGPSEDGGYYLLGLKESTPSIFKNITWSTDTVLKETETKLQALNKTYTLLPTLNDIDTEEDLKNTKLYGNLYSNH